MREERKMGAVCAINKCLIMYDTNQSSSSRGNHTHTYKTVELEYIRSNEWKK